MPRFSRLLIICSWCSTLLGTKPTTAGQTGVTHSICTACLITMKGTTP